MHGFHEYCLLCLVTNACLWQSAINGIVNSLTRQPTHEGGGHNTHHTHHTHHTHDTHHTHHIYYFYFLVVARSRASGRIELTRARSRAQSMHKTHRVRKNERECDSEREREKEKERVNCSRSKVVRYTTESNFDLRRRSVPRCELNTLYTRRLNCCN